MDNRAIRVLLIEDDEDDYVLTRELLAEIKGKQFDLEWVPTYEAGLAALALGRHDVYLLDYRLNVGNGLDLIREAVALGCKAPLILLTGVNDERIDFEATRAGAADFLVKGQIDAPTLERAIRYAIESKRTHEALRKAREELETRVQERTAALRKANVQLAEADRRKDEFLAMLGHELRNPLAPLRNALQILQVECTSNVVATQMTAMMERQLSHLVVLVDDLLDVSRISLGKISLRKEPVELTFIVDRAVESIRPFIEERRHHLDVILPSAPVHLEVDVPRVEQVLINLLNNAAKYTEPGGRISLSAALRGDQVELRVRDNGIGIRPEMLPRIFDLFQQADRVPGQVSEGLGLGLTLVRNLVGMHGGAVSAHSDGPGQGSEFVVSLSLAREAKESSVSIPEEPLPKSNGPLRILAVDDNVDAANSMATLLRFGGNEVRVAHDGPSALELARTFLPDAILLDIGLPKGMDGYELARRLRREVGLDKALLIAITGYGQEGDRLRSRETGIDAHLVKPVPLKELYSLLNQAKQRAPSPVG